MSEESEQPEPAEELVGQVDEEFPEEWRNDFEGLAYIGYLERVVPLPGHEVVLRTLLAGEKIQVVSIAQDLEGSVGYSRIYKAAAVAAALVSVDGRPIMIQEKNKGVVRQKFEFVINLWHDVVIDYLFPYVKDLEARQVQIMKDSGFFK